MSDKVLPDIKYEITIKIDDFETGTIDSLYVYRVPFVKYSCIGIITLSMPYEFMLKMQNKLASGNGFTFDVTINLANMEKYSDNNFHSHVVDDNFRLDLKLVALHLKQRAAPAAVQTQIVPVTLYFVQRSVYLLTKGNSFGQYFYKRTVNKVYNDYKIFVSNLLSSNRDTSRKERVENTLNNEVTNEFKSDYVKFIEMCAISGAKYDSILTRCVNDLMVIPLLIQFYKLTSDPVYFFIDMMDFRASCLFLLVDISKPNSYSKWNSFDDNKFDIRHSLRLLGKTPLKDVLSKFNGVVIYTEKLYNHQIRFAKRKGFRMPSRFYDKVSIVPYNKMLGRHVYKKTEHGIGTEIPHSGLIENVYSPDGGAFSRIGSMREFLNSVDNIYRFEAKNIHLDVLRLTRCYALDRYSPKTYFVPISIVNIFTRYNTIETTLVHSAQFNAIRYEDVI